MTYQIRFPTRRLEAVFGTAYPGLDLSDHHKTRFILGTVAKTHGLSPGYGGQIEIDFESYIFLFWRRHDYSFKINLNRREGYVKALAVEKFLYGVKRLDWLSPPRFWNKWFRSSRPSDTFLITDMDYGKIFQWLQENVTYSDYQIYSKFGEDISLGFRNPEHATMFKLTFGDQDI